MLDGGKQFAMLTANRTVQFTRTGHKTMHTTPHHLEFALFGSRRGAARAQAIVKANANTDAEIITHETDLTNERIPLCLTMARSGAVIGASAVAVAVTAGFISMLGLQFDTLHASPLVSLLTLGLLSSLLGALAGALSFSTESKHKLRLLCKFLRCDSSLPDDEQPAALLLDSTDDIDELLREHGALKTESLT